MARKGENIYKRKDGRWEGRYIKSRSSTGKANYGYVYAKSYREVKAKLISQSSCTSNSVTVDPEISSDQFEQVAMEWFQAICPKVKESTSNKYRNLLSSYILPVFGSKQLRDITHEFIETQCNFFLVSGGLKENGLSSKTVSDILSLIRNVLQFATRNGKAISCDARSIQIKRQTKEMRVLSRAEQEKLCQYLYSNLDSCNIGILVCLFTGLRVGEICALRWEDVSFSDYLSDRELGNPEGFWTRNGREGWSRENILRRASHIQDVRQNTESGMSLDELSQNPVLDDTIRSYYNNPVQVAQVGSYYVFQSDGRHRTLAAQSLDTYIPVLVTGSYTRND